MTHHNILPNIENILNTNYLIVTAFLIGIISLYIPLYVITNPYTILYTTALVTASILALLVKSNKCDIIIEDTNSELNKPLLILYFTSIIAVTIAFWMSGFNRSIIVHGFTYGTYLMAIIYYLNSNNSVKTILLLIGVAVQHRATIYFTSGSPYGGDEMAHYRRTIELSNEGFLIDTVISSTKYYFSPFYYILGSYSSNITSLTVEQGAIFFTISISLLVVTGLLLYYIATQVWGSSVGVVAMLLYFSSDYILSSSTAIGTTEYGSIFAILLIYTSYKYVFDNDGRILILHLVFCVSIILTHQLSTFIAFFLCFSLLALAFIFFKQPRTVFPPLIIIGLVTYIDWTTARFSATGSETVFERFFVYFSALISAGGVGSTDAMRIPESANVVSSGLFSSLDLINVVGSTLLIGLMGVGMLSSVSKNRQGRFVMMLGGAAGCLLLTITVGQLLGTSVLRPGRLFVFLYPLMSILGAVGLIKLSNNWCSTYIKFVILIVFLGMYLVLMGGNAIGAQDDPIFDSAPGAERQAYTEQEEKMIRFTTEYLGPNTDVHGDFRIELLLRRFEGVDEAKSILIEYESSNIVLEDNRSSHMIIHREYLYSGNARFNLDYGRTSSVHGELNASNSQLSSFSMIYQAEDGTCGENSCGIYFNRSEL